MSAIRGKHTAPELAVRRALKKMGVRFKLHGKKIPGTPDLVLTESRTLIFVHGCFWHQHPRCRRRSVPKSNRAYWVGKLKRNVVRFTEVRKELRGLGWKVVVVWECQTKKDKSLIKSLGTKLGAQSYK